MAALAQSAADRRAEKFAAEGEAKANVPFHTDIHAIGGGSLRALFVGALVYNGDYHSEPITAKERLLSTHWPPASV